ncbi:MAG: glycosyltransferase family 4 protein [Candidatus Omnitrophica bacterium]|nr:glycosyltransferase family 4 protein [Candidatus Omnitrophota bacterium]
MTRITPKDQAKAGFGVEFDWDIPLLRGYNHIFARNISRNPSVGAFRGIVLEGVERLFKGISPDIIIVFGWFPYGYQQVIRYANKNRIPLFIRGESNLLMTMFVMKKIFKEFYMRYLLKKFDRFLSIGKQNTFFYRHFGVDNTKIFFTPYSVDTDFFRKEFAKHKRDKDKFNFGFSGKFIHKKRPCDFLEAAAKSKNRKQIRVIMIGEGPLKGELSRLGTRLGLDVEFRGFLNQGELVKTGYCDIDCLVLPSGGSETWGLVVNEVMTGGIPAIVSDAVGCGLDLIEEGRSGFTFRYKDVDCLSEKIDTFIELKKKDFPFSKFVLDKIEDYSLYKTVEGFLETIASI